MAWSVNKCAGRRWRTASNGSIEVEGEGFPLVAESDPRFAYMMQTWNNWGHLFERAAAKYKIPVSWLLAIASIETGFVSSNPAKQASIVSPAGAQGIMQIMPGTAQMYGYSAAQRSDPEVSVDIGAHFISDLARGRTGPELPHIGSAYNAGPGSGSLGVRCSPGNEWNMTADHNYPRQVIEYNNAAIHYLDVNSSMPTWAVALGGAMFTLAAAAVAYVYVPEIRGRF